MKPCWYGDIFSLLLSSQTPVLLNSYKRRHINFHPVACIFLAAMSKHWRPTQPPSCFPFRYSCPGGHDLASARLRGDSSFWWSPLFFRLFLQGAHALVPCSMVRFPRLPLQLTSFSIKFVTVHRAWRVHQGSPPCTGVPGPAADAGSVWVSSMSLEILLPLTGRHSLVTIIDQPLILRTIRK